MLLAGMLWSTDSWEEQLHDAAILFCRFHLALERRRALLPGCLLGSKAFCTEAALLIPFPTMQWWELVGSKPLFASSLPPALGLKLKACGQWHHRASAVSRGVSTTVACMVHGSLVTWCLLLIAHLSYTHLGRGNTSPLLSRAQATLFCPLPKHPPSPAKQHPYCRE